MGTMIVSAAVGLLIAMAFRSLYRDKKAGKSCAGCSGCAKASGCTGASGSAGASGCTGASDCAGVSGCTGTSGCTGASGSAGISCCAEKSETGKFGAASGEYSQNKEDWFRIKKISSE